MPAAGLDEGEVKPSEVETNASEFYLDGPVR
jgi:hypothetical protein